MTAGLAQLLDRAAAERKERYENVTIRQNANSSGHSRVIQVAGDARIGKLS